MGKGNLLSQPGICKYDPVSVKNEHKNFFSQSITVFNLFRNFSIMFAEYKARKKYANYFYFG